MRRSHRTSSRAAAQLQGADREVTAGEEGAIGDATPVQAVQREVDPIAPHAHAPHPLGLGDRRLVLGTGQGERRIGEVGREPGDGELDQGVGPQHQARGGEPRPVHGGDARVEHDAGRLEAGVLERHRGASARARPPQVKTHRGEGDLGDAKGGDAERPDQLAHRDGRRPRCRLAPAESSRVRGASTRWTTSSGGTPAPGRRTIASARGAPGRRPTAGTRAPPPSARAAASDDGRSGPSRSSRPRSRRRWSRPVEEATESPSARR